MFGYSEPRWVVKESLNPEPPRFVKDMQVEDLGLVSAP